MLDIFKRMLTFEGRASRLEYWALFLTQLFGYFAIVFVIAFFSGLFDVGEGPAIIAGGLLAIPLIWLQVAVRVRRWHDLGKPGTYVFIAFIPYVGGLITLVWQGFVGGEQGPNLYGPAPGEGFLPMNDAGGGSFLRPTDD